MQMATTEQKKTNHIAGIILTVLLIAGACVGGYWYINTIQYVSTDDAAIDSDHVTVNSKMMGRIAQLMVDEGSKVKTGQLLVQLDQNDLIAQEAQSVAALKTAEENLQLTRVNSHRIRADLDRTQQLYNSQLISKQQYDHDANAVDAANVQSSIAQTQIEAAKAQLGIINNQLRNTKIYAPASGIIAKRSASSGEVVQPGQAIFTINDLNHVWVKANFEETKIRFIRLGHEADIFIDAYPHRVFKGKIVQIGADIVPPPLSVGESTKTTQKIPVKIIFAKREESKLFVPGMSVEVKVKAR